MHYAAFIVICLVWGSSFILMKKAAAVFGPVSIGAWRVAGGAAILLAIWVALGRAGRRWPLSRRDLPALLVPAAIGSVYPFTVQPHLIAKHQDSAYFGVMVALVPLLTIVASAGLLRVLPTARQVVGVGGGLIGMGVLFGDGLGRGVPAGDVALAVTVPAAYALSNTFIKRRFTGVHPVALTASSLGLASLGLIPLAAGSEALSPSASEPWVLAGALGAVLVLGVVGTGLMTGMFYGLIQARGPLFAGMVTYIIPLGALGWGWADGEPVTAAQLAAVGVVLGSVALVQWPGRRGVAPPARSPGPVAAAPSVQPAEASDGPGR